VLRAPQSLPPNITKIHSRISSCPIENALVQCLGGSRGVTEAVISPYLRQPRNRLRSHLAFFSRYVHAPASQSLVEDDLHEAGGWALCILLEIYLQSSDVTIHTSMDRRVLYWTLLGLLRIWENSLSSGASFCTRTSDSLHHTRFYTADR
jgi:hypothetical protein